MIFMAGFIFNNNPNKSMGTFFTLISVVIFIGALLFMSNSNNKWVALLPLFATKDEVTGINKLFYYNETPELLEWIKDQKQLYKEACDAALK